MTNQELMVKSTNSVYVLDAGAPPSIDTYFKDTKPFYQHLDSYKALSVPALDADGTWHWHGSASAYRIVRICPDVNLTHIRVLNGDGVGDLEYYLQGLQMVWDMGKPGVINSSLGVTLPAGVTLQKENLNFLGIAPFWLKSACFVDGEKMQAEFHVDVIDQIEAMSKKMVEAGYVFATASGNESSQVPSYPASSPYHVAIGADKAANMSTFSNKGERFLTSGEDLTLYCWDDVREHISGTSFAAPDFAGIAARMLQDRPELTQADIVLLCSAWARHQHAGMPLKCVFFQDQEHGWGDINWVGEKMATDYNRFVNQT